MNQIIKETKEILSKLGDKVEEQRQKNLYCVSSIDDLDKIPNSPGCYWIKTTMPISKFDQSKRRKTPPAKTAFIEQQKGLPYTVYSGTEADIRKRLKQHLFNEGHEKTIKLGLKLDKPPYNRYSWYVSYVIIEDPIIRYAIESWWRSKFGWPQLCKR